MNFFGNEIRKQRLVVGLTQKDVADEMGWSDAYLSQIENGQRNPPSVGDIRKIAMVIGGDGNSLLKSAAIDRGVVRILVGNLTPKKRKLVLAFMKMLDEIDDNDAEKIRKVIEK